jgi:glycerol-3-phosphate dehydrogenase
MPYAGEESVDAVIFGGGAAGLWLLDELIRGGVDALLLEANDLGSGQTIASQGIIHGGLKYTLTGLFTPSAKSIRDMPVLWRRCLAGEAKPDLSKTRLRAEFCYLWRTTSITSKLAMIGARAGLRVAPVKLESDERPAALASCPGTVARLDEQVIDPGSLLADFSSRHASRLLKIDAQHGLEFVTGEPGNVKLIRLINPETGEPLDIAPRCVVLLAGGGNESLHERIGLGTTDGSAMQRRPLHMVMARGDLPTLNGHCVDGAATRVTITTARDYANRTIWQIGGQIAEEGTAMDSPTLITHARNELREAVPDVDFTCVHWATYKVDRAEAAAGGRRPEEPSVMREGNTITGWPTKLALVPKLVEQIVQGLSAFGCRLSAEEKADSRQPRVARNWPRPVIAEPPWETAQWFPGD